MVLEIILFSDEDHWISMGCYSGVSTNMLNEGSLQNNVQPLTCKPKCTAGK